jgi:ABC-2 type transport system ATP-binding protein
MSDVLVDVDNLQKTYGPLRALDGLTFQVKRGEIVGLLGANGAGKSTLMKILNCYLNADGGTAKVAGVSVDTDPVGVRRHIGYLPENAPLYTEMRVRDFLYFVAKMRGLPSSRRAERVDWAVKSCGLTPKYMANIGTLSRGFRQRVGIAQAILHDPELLILDEPTSGLDPIQLIEIRRLIMDIGKTNTVFFSTHIMQEVEAVCNRTIVIARGKLVADGTPGELKAKYAEKGRVKARVRGITVEEAEKALKDLPGIKRLECKTLTDLGIVECSLYVSEDGQAPTQKDLSRAAERFFGVAQEKDWAVVELHSEGLSLEDMFLKAAGHGR